MHVVVTGAAGFIGSRLASFLADRGDTVTAIDCFLPDLYSAEVKKSKWQELSRHSRINLAEIDLRYDDLGEILAGADTVVNLAAMPGLVKSWTDLDVYMSCNTIAAGRLMTASVENAISHFVQISTSSVYGKFATGNENSPTNPTSPYGVSKLAAEKLGWAYTENFGLPFSVLRYFSVYGPGQRPDMAYHRFISAALSGAEIVVFGDGNQTRTNTYIDDCVSATVSAIDNKSIGSTYNVSGNNSVSINHALETIGSLTQKKLNIRYEEVRAGDQTETKGNIALAELELGYKPIVSFEEGINNQISWQKGIR